MTFKRIPLAAEALTNATKEDAEFYGKKVDDLFHEFKTYYMSKELREKEENNAIAKTQIFQFIDSRSSELRSTTERANLSYPKDTIPTNDSDFYTNCK